MARLIAPVAFLGDFSEQMKDALVSINELMLANSSDTIEFCRAGIKDNMGDSCLSRWVALLIQTIFRYTYEGDEKFNVLLRAIKQIHEGAEQGLIEFRNSGKIQYGKTFERLENLRQEQRNLMTTSFYPANDGKTILDRDKELRNAIEVLKKATNPALALFLVVEKIIKHLEGCKPYSAKIKVYQKEISENPLAGIVQLLPILNLLQTADPSNLAEIVRLVLQLIDVEDASLAASVQKKLFKKGWLKITDEPLEAEEELEEQAQATGCFSGLARAASQLFFKKRKNRVFPEIQMQQVSTTDMDDISFGDSPEPEDEHASLVRGVVKKKLRDRVDILEIISEEGEPVEDMLQP